MSDASVTRDGLEGVRPGREAKVRSGVEGDRPRDRLRGNLATGEVRGSQDHSYYGQPIINLPTWAELDIAGYLFMGGLAGGSSLLAAGADLTGRPRLARGSGICASVAIAGSLVALIHDLGRPERFLNMLRVFKPTSPMSVGVWILVAYAPLNFAASASAATGVLRPVGRAAGVGAALMGAGVASYTAALIADTAVPAWHEGHRELPFVFVGSAASAAAGWGLVVAPRSEQAPARRMALIGAVSELVAEQLMERRLGSVAQTLHQGVAGRRLRLSKGLSAAGIAGAALLAPRSRAGAAVTGAALLASSALTRFGLFAAGISSAEDPKYTVELQRARLEARQQGM